MFHYFTFLLFDVLDKILPLLNSRALFASADIPMMLYFGSQIHSTERLPRVLMKSPFIQLYCFMIQKEKVNGVMALQDKHYRTPAGLETWV